MPQAPITTVAGSLGYLPIASSLSRENEMWKVRSLLTIASFFAFVSQSAQADIIVNAIESGGNVVISGDGTVDLDGLAFNFNSSNTIFGVQANVGRVTFSGPLSFYTGISGPYGIGPGTSFFRPTSASGNSFGIWGGGPSIAVPQGYVSGSPLSASMTFDGTTFASLGLTPGTYVWTWGNSPTGPGSAAVHSFTMNIGSQAIPEPGSMSLCAAGGLLGIILLRRRRNRAVA